MPKSNFYCSCCKKNVSIEHSECTTGYATKRNNHKVCYNCCAKLDKERMIKDGQITLYLTMLPKGMKKDGTIATIGLDAISQLAKITNWPGSLIIWGRWKKGRHNIVNNRYDVWFMFENSQWHGVQYGDNTQLLHCKQVKK
jgi:hypothetical protein